MNIQTTLRQHSRAFRVARVIRNRCESIKAIDSVMRQFHELAWKRAAEMRQERAMALLGQRGARALEAEAARVAAGAKKCGVKIGATV